jgi:oligopeptide transport system substrate-binding protein
MNKNRWFCFLGFLLVSQFSFAEESQNSTPSDNVKTFTFRIQGEPETLDWNRAHTPIESYVLTNIMEGLLTFDGNLKVVSALATDWKISPDGKVYTFNIRQGVKWTDGVELTAEDFVYSWKRLLSPVTAASYAYMLFDIVGAEDYNRGKLQDFSKVGIQATSKYQFSVTLKQPLTYWIYIPTFWVTFPMRQDIVEKFGPGWETPGRMVTLGPYQYVSHDLESKIVLTANPNYYGKRGNIEKVVGLIVRDDTTALTLYESGRLDFLVDISTVDLKRLAGRKDLKTFPYIKTGYLGFVTSKYPVSDVKLRRAIAMAIDKSQLGKILYGGQQAATSFVPPPLLGSSKSVGLKFDPLQAKDELRASGVDLTKTLKLDLVLPNWDKPTTVAQFIQQQLKKNLSVQADIHAFDHRSFRTQLDLFTYPLLEASWSGDYPDADNFLSLFMGAAGNNKTSWKNAEYDSLVIKGRSEKNQKKREKIYLDAQKILLETDAVIVPLYYEPNMALVKARVKGFELNPLNYLQLRKINLGP